MRFKPLNGYRRIAALALLLAWPTAPATAASWQQVLERLSPSIVYLSIAKTNKQTGAVQTITATGFVVGKDGYVLTAAHSLTDPIKDADGRDAPTLFPPEIRGRIRDNAGPTESELRIDTLARVDDLALLQFKQYTIPMTPATIGRASGVGVGDPLAAFGFPLDQPLGYRDVKVGSKGGIGPHWNIEAAIAPGMSGAPVVNFNGEVVAVIIGADNRAVDLKYAMPINVAMPLLKKAEAPIVAVPARPANAQAISKPIEHTDGEAPDEARVIRSHVRAVPIPAGRQLDWAQVTVHEQSGLNESPIIDIPSSGAVVNVRYALESGPRSAGRIGRLKAVLEMMLLPNP